VALYQLPMPWCVLSGGRQPFQHIRQLGVHLPWKLLVYTSSGNTDLIIHGLLLVPKAIKMVVVCPLRHNKLLPILWFSHLFSKDCQRSEFTLHAELGPCQAISSQTCLLSVSIRLNQTSEVRRYSTCHRTVWYRHL